LNKQARDNSIRILYHIATANHAQREFWKGLERASNESRPNRSPDLCRGSFTPDLVLRFALRTKEAASSLAIARRRMQRELTFARRHASPSTDCSSLPCPRVGSRLYQIATLSVPFFAVVRDRNALRTDRARIADSGFFELRSR
jgi:hypothetical protein